MNLKRVVITGLGALTPIGNNLQEYWQGLEEGRSGGDFITKFNAEKFKTKFACELKNFHVLDHLDRKEVKRTDPFTQYALIVAEEAMQNAQIDLENIDRTKAGVIWGCAMGGMTTFEEQVQSYVEQGYNPRFNPFFIPKTIVDICSGHLSIKYGFRGPNFVTVSACASATNAMVDAFNYIRWGKSKLMITGGSEASITEGCIGGFGALKALSQFNEAPDKASRPFDKDRDGFVMGEGAGAIILEELEQAKARGANIYAEVIGGGATSDAYHMTAPHPEGLGAESVMLDALEDANIKAEEIDYVNVHGTGTPIGDRQELKAVRKVFGEHSQNLHISSTKSMTGHLLGAAGAIEAIASVMAIQKQIIPPTINVQEIDPELDQSLNYTLNQAQKREVKTVLSNTFGFGGHNFSVILRKFEE